MNELILACALALPPANFMSSPYHVMKSEYDQLVEWLRKNNPDAEVFIHPTPQEDKLKDAGFERVPFTWRGNHIWIRRKEVSDKYIRRSA